MINQASPSSGLWPTSLSILLLTGIFFPACRPDASISEPGQVAASSRIRLEEVSGMHTGITFNNSIDETGRINIFTWHFLYNGAGVAAGDINNDGLPDLYFAGTMTADKIYLNKGDFRFEDITASSGIQPGMFSSGVTMADVNADGLMDIYVCKNSPTGIADNNRNQLYINQGGNRFLEKAAEYGLADIGFSVQATFFDADQDGDLDMYLVNQPFDEFARLVNRPEVVMGYPETDRIFLQENGFFHDHTAAFGLLNGRNGLSASLGDYDLNGWTDLYICNDYHLGDHLYMNHNGRWTDQLAERAGHTSFYSMGSDAGDINNDGWPDIFTLDMAFEDHYRSKTNMGSMDPARFWGLVADGHHYQYMQNVLQINQGDGYFSDMAQLAGLAKTDWSWSALLADLNYDARQDILVTNGVLRDMQNNDFNQMVKNRYQGMVGPHNFIEVLHSLPSQPVRNLIFQNEGDLQFSRLQPEEGFARPGFSHGMAYADLDGDGWLDLVVNNMNAPASVYKNMTDRQGHYLTIRLKGPDQNRQGLGVTILAFSGGDVQTHTMQTTRGYMSSVEPAICLGLGSARHVDSLFVIWNHTAMSVIRRIPADQSITVDFDKEKKIPFRNPLVRQAGWIADKAPAFQHAEQPFDDYREQVLLPYKLSQQGPFVASADINGDGIPDLFAGGGAGQAGAIFVGRPDGTFAQMEQPALQADRGAEDQQAVFFDVDGDGDPDLFVVSGSNEFHDDHPALRDRLYLNDGRGLLSAAPAGMLPDYRINGQCVAAFDLGGDGDTDLIVFGRLRGGRYGDPADAILLENENGRLINVTAKAASFLRSFGMVTDAAVADIDGDGDDDMLVVGEWQAPTLLLQQPGGKIDSQSLSDPGRGLWWTVETGDMDGDGDADFLLGNLGWNNKFGGRGPVNLEVYAGDLDVNGDFDVVLAVEKKDKVLPVRGRECSSQELPFILDKFPTYDSFAKAGLSDIYPPEMLGHSSHFKLNTLSSIYLDNQGDGRFTVRQLPLACQTGPVKSFAAGDFNGDGDTDFIYAGNHLPTEVETARYDGLSPGIAYGDGEGNFVCRHLPLQELVFPGDFRDIALLKFPSATPSLIMSVNNGPLLRLQPD